jgi:hypothetical protein
VRKQSKYILHQLSLAYDWLFDELTRPIEMLSSVSMFLFSCNLLLNNTELLKLPSYSSFKYVTPPELWIIFILISICQFFATAIPTIKANKSSGYCLMVSGAVWAWIAISLSTKLQLLSKKLLIVSAFPELASLMNFLNVIVWYRLKGLLSYL